jgi:hypothetical protein
MGFDIGGKILSSELVTPDGTLYAQRFRRVTANMIDAVNTSGTSSINSSGNDSNGYYRLNFQHSNSGCDSSGFAIKIKRDIEWSFLMCDFYMEGGASCWNFNADGYSPSSGMLTWDANSGDLFMDAFNSFELPQYTKKSNACDNEPTNFMHGGYLTGSNRGFTMLSRRNGTSYAGPTHGRACNGSGITIVSNIIIF